MQYFCSFLPFTEPDWRAMLARLTWALPHQFTFVWQSLDSFLTWSPSQDLLCCPCSGIEGLCTSWGEHCPFLLCFHPWFLIQFPLQSSSTLAASLAALMVNSKESNLLLYSSYSINLWLNYFAGSQYFLHKESANLKKVDFWRTAGNYWCLSNYKNIIHHRMLDSHL